MPESPSTADSAGESRRVEDLSCEERRHLIWACALRISTVVTLMFVGYAIAPLDHRADDDVAIRALGTIVVIVIVVGLQFRAIQAARFPALRAIEGFALILPLLLLGFAATYVRMSTADPDAFSQPLDRVGGVYFSMTILSTVGFGDIAATTNTARITVMMQMLADVIVIGVVARLMINSVKLHTGRARDEPIGRGGRAGQ